MDDDALGRDGVRQTTDKRQVLASALRIAALMNKEETRTTTTKYSL